MYSQVTSVCKNQVLVEAYRGLQCVHLFVLPDADWGGYTTAKSNSIPNTLYIVLCTTISIHLHLILEVYWIKSAPLSSIFQWELAITSSHQFYKFSCTIWTLLELQVHVHANASSEERHSHTIHIVVYTYPSQEEEINWLCWYTMLVTRSPWPV